MQIRKSLEALSNSGITVLDICSSDYPSEYLEMYSQEYPLQIVK